VEQICHELEIHAKLEEDIFYPAIPAQLREDGPDLVEEAIKEHNEMKRLIGQLQTGSLADTDYDRTVHQLMHGVQHHIREEENEMLPRAEQQLGNTIERLGVQMQQRKQQLLAAMSTMGQLRQGTLAQHKIATDKDSGGSSTIEQSIDVHVPIHVAYNQWTQFETFPSFMESVEQVRHGAEIMSCFIAACILAPAPQHFSGRIPHSLKHLSASGASMAFYFQKSYHPAIEPLVCQYDQSLSEKDRRPFAALEAIPLGHGGIRYMSKVLGGDPQTIKDGMRELKQLPEDPAGRRLRKPGGGRQKTEVTQADVIQQVHDTLKDRTAGDPMREDVVWTDVTPQELADRRQAHGVCAGPRLVRRLRDTLGVARRQRAQGWAGGDSPHRDAPLRHLAHRMHELLEAGNPVLRLDTKKKACLETLSRDGKVDCQQALNALDHDSPPLARGVIMPHGLDDLARHQGWMPVGLRRDTTAFACESLRFFWHSDGRRLSPNASAILLLCDGGGRNSGHKHLLKEDLQDVVNDLAVPIRVAHDPAYGSQGNPIARQPVQPRDQSLSGGPL